MTITNATPVQRLMAVLILMGLCLAGVISLAHWQPYTGLTIEIQDNTLRLAASEQAHMPLNAQVLGIGPVAGPLIELSADDFIEEPHFLPSYQAMTQFFSRQSQLSQLIQQPGPLVIRLQPADAPGPQDYPLAISPTTPIAALPAVFWFQLLVSSLGCVLGCWIWALRPKQLAPRLFALLNTAFPLFAYPAAIYSSRHIALDGQLMQWLVALNTAGSLLYGCGLISLFLIYPKALIKPIWLWGIPVFFALWWLLDTLCWLPDPRIGTDLPITLQMLAAILCMLWQWHTTRHDVHARIILRWFAAWMLISCGLFVFLIQSSQLANMPMQLSQGYSFGFFLMASIGIAVGLRRYRLFNLDQWAFRLLFWLAGALLLIMLDALLIVVLSPVLSLSVAVLICGSIWLPARGWLQGRLLYQQRMPDNELFLRIVEIGFAINRQQRYVQFQRTLQDLFKPLQLEIAAHPPHTVCLMQDGLELHIPPVDDLPALIMGFPSEGRRLFNAHDIKLVNSLQRWISQANDRRAAYDQGVFSERVRIARDLHDDLGARLLSGLYQQDIVQIKQIIRHAIADMRAIVSGLSGTALQLHTLLQSIHQETESRLLACGIKLTCTIDTEAGALTLDYDFYKNYISVMRELITNLIKYAHATEVWLDIKCLNGQLNTRLCDNGKGFNEAQNHLKLQKSSATTLDDPLQQASHFGLDNLMARIKQYNGKLSFNAAAQGGTCVNVELPLYPVASYSD